MKRCLILLTGAYPFAAGEAYLETELPILAQRFDCILLFTVGLSPGMAPILPTPANVTVCNCAETDAKRGKLRDVFSGIPAAVKALPMAEDDRRETGKNPARRVFAGYYQARVRRFTREIGSALECMDFSGFASVTIYSYWLFAAASAAAQLRDIVRQRGGAHVRVISRAHGYDIYAERNALSFLPCRTALLETVDAVYACSENGREYLSKRYPQFAGKIRTAYLGAADGGMTAGSADGVIRVLTCSRAVPLKRLERVADALRLLPATCRAEWTHLGDGSSLALVRKKTETLPGNIAVRLPGELPHEDVLRYYRTHPTDVFVSVSASEGLPVSAMEAMAFGVPIVMTDVGGCAELTDGRSNGILLPASFTDAALKEAILAVSAAGETMRASAYAVWRQRFDAQKNYTSFADMLCSEQ